MPKATPHHQRGFSLIEMSVIITVFGLMMAMMLQTRTTAIEAEAVSASQDKLDTIERAIMLFNKQNGYFPCPASRQAAEGSAGFGVSTDCNLTSAPTGTYHIGTGTDEYQVRVGALPTRTLGIPDENAVDEWGNYYSYAMIRTLGINQATYDAYAPTQASDYFQIVNSASAVTYGNNNAELIGYIIISHGADRKGAYSKSGVASVSCGSTARDSENCDLDKQFMDAPITDLTTDATFFYDLIRWETKANVDAL